MTPTGSVEPGDFAGKGAPRSDQDPSEGTDAAVLSPGSLGSGSDPSVDADADSTDVDEDGSDAEVEADGSGNGKSSDLVTRGGKVRATRATRATQATRAATRVVRSTPTKKTSKKVVNTSLKKVSRGGK